VSRSLVTRRSAATGGSGRLGVRGGGGGRGLGRGPGRGGGRRPGGPGERRGKWSRIEIQIHPSDIRKRVRYLFLEPRQVVIAGLGLLLYLGFVGFALSLSPDVVGSLLSRQEYRQMLAERERQGERMEALVGRLERIGTRGEDLRLKLSKIFLAYGLSTEDSIGQGGFPFRPAPAPENSRYAELIGNGNELMARLQEQDQVLGAFLDEVDDFEKAHVEQARTTPSLSPLKGKAFVLTSPYGQRRSPFTKQPDFHAGIDLAAPVGTEVYAPADGFVSFAGRYPLRRSVGWWRYGNLIVLRHGDRFVTLYGHLDEIRVRRNQRVKQGDVLGAVGNTGWSTSPHLHYEVRRKEEGEFRPVDPRIYILDHQWRDEERLLVRARSAPDLNDFEPLPRLLTR
jgi:murein DD-endopeptidase MepM/ murein hydrolase activator NlpD